MLNTDVFQFGESNYGMDDTIRYDTIRYDTIRYDTTLLSLYDVLCPLQIVWLFVNFQKILKM